MTDTDRAKEWTRFVMAAHNSASLRIQTLINLDPKMRQLVLQEMGCRTAEELVERVAE